MAIQNSSINTSATLLNLEREYRQKKRALSVNFREIVPWIPYNSQRYTHALHSYPAKVIPQIPHFFLSAGSITPPKASVLDPFCGSGTVSLETCLAGCDAVASDSNPLARLLTRVKTTPISPTRLSRNITHIKQLVRVARTTTPPPVVNLTYWYPTAAIEQLSRIRSAIDKVEAPDLRALAQIAFSNCARRASLTDPRVSVPVRLKPERYGKTHPLYRESKERLERILKLDVIEAFFEILEHFSAQISTLWPIRSRFGHLDTVYANSLPNEVASLASHRKESIDLIITSPPYLGAQKYIRATSLSLTWLGLSKEGELRHLERKSIGREHFEKAEYAEQIKCSATLPDRLISEIYQKNPLRAHIAAKYLIEMGQVLDVSYRLLKPGGKLVLVSGCNSLCGKPFNTTKYLTEACKKAGFQTLLELNDTIKSRGLMTRRNRTAGIIPTESVVLFGK